MKTSGTHLLAEYHGCPTPLLNDLDALRALMLQAVAAVGATPLHVTAHRFAPQGVTVVIPVAESHFSLHTWPEHGYAAVDVYTCGELSPSPAFDTLREGLGSQTTELLELERGAGPAGRSIQVKRWLGPQGEPLNAEGPRPPK